MQELWKDIKGYEGYYQISDLGRVKSLNRVVSVGNNNREVKERFLNLNVDGHGYYFVRLCKYAKMKNFRVHILVWEHFGVEHRDGRILQVDHKDENKKNNRIDNLQLLTSRGNTRKYHETYLVKPIGIDIIGKKFRAKAIIKNKTVHIGMFNTMVEASEAREKYLRCFNG